MLQNVRNCKKVIFDRVLPEMFFDNVIGRQRDRFSWLLSLIEEVNESEGRVTIYNAVRDCVIKWKACQWTQSAFYNAAGLNASSPSQNKRERHRTLMHLWTYSGKPYWIRQQWVLFHTVKLSLAVVKRWSMVKGKWREEKKLDKNEQLQDFNRSKYLL